MGEQVFRRVGCDDCHRETLRTVKDYYAPWPDGTVHRVVQPVEQPAGWEMRAPGGAMPMFAGGPPAFAAPAPFAGCSTDGGTCISSSWLRR